MTTYYSNNNLFAYTVTSNSSYALDSTDYSVIADVFNRWDTLISGSRLGENYQIAITMTIDQLGSGILGGTSVHLVYNIGGSQTFGNIFPATASITLNDSYVISMKSDVRDTGKTEYYYVLLHEVGHVLGIGTFWGLSGAPIVSYQEDGLTKYYYTGQHAVREYKRHLSPIANDIVGIPIEDNGLAGTINVHPEEGNEGHVSKDKRYINGVFHPGLDTELMTGWMDGTPQSTPLSRITLGFLEDIGFNVNYNLADYYRPMTNWLDLSNNANCFKSIYEQGFVDLSGGSIQTRNDDQKLIIAGDSSLNNAYLGESAKVMKTFTTTTIANVNITGTVANMISQHGNDETLDTGYPGKDFIAISGDGKTYAIWYLNGTDRLYVYKDLGDGNGYTKIVDDYNFPSDNEAQVKLNYDGTKMLLAALEDLQSYGGNDNGGLVIILEYDPTKTTSNTDYTHTSGILPADYGPENWKIMGNAIFGPNNARIGDNMDNMHENVSISDDGLTFAFGTVNVGETVYVYTWNGTAWELKGNTITEPATLTSFGKYLSLSGDGDSIIIGSENDKHYVYKWTGTEWEQQGGYIDLNIGGLQRGQAINTDGTVIAVGDRNQNGRIKIFDRNPSEAATKHVGWTQRGGTITGASNSYIGARICITKDGNMIATPSYTSSSQATIYKYNNSNNTWENIPYDNNIDSNAAIKQIALSKFGTHTVLINQNTNKVQVHEIAGENVYEQESRLVDEVSNMVIGCDTATAQANNYKLDISGTMDICGNLFSSGDINGINTYLGEVPGTTVLGYDIENSANLNSSTMVSENKTFANPNATATQSFTAPNSGNRGTGNSATETSTGTTTILGSTYNFTYKLSVNFGGGYNYTKYLSRNTSYNNGRLDELLAYTFICILSSSIGNSTNRRFDIDFYVSTSDSTALPFSFSLTGGSSNYTSMGTSYHAPYSTVIYNDWPTKVGCRLYWALNGTGSSHRSLNGGARNIIPHTSDATHLSLSMNNIGNRYAAGYIYTPGIWEVGGDTSVQNQNGCVKIYDDTQNNGTWTESAVIHGDTHLGEFGRYVGLSGDGKTVLVSKAGASNNQTIYLYKYDETNDTWGSSLDSTTPPYNIHDIKVNKDGTKFMVHITGSSTTNIYGYYGRLNVYSINNNTITLDDTISLYSITSARQNITSYATNSNMDKIIVGNSYVYSSYHLVPTSNSWDGACRVYEYRKISQSEWDNGYPVTNGYDYTKEEPAIATNDTNYDSSKKYWYQKGTTVIGPNQSSYYGKNVGINYNGTTIATYEQNSSYGVKVYKYTNNDWVLTSTLQGSSGTRLGELFLEMHPAGNIMYVSNRYPDGIQGYKYNESNTTWEVFTNSITISDINDMKSVSMNKTGDKLAVSKIETTQDHQVHAFDTSSIVYEMESVYEGGNIFVGNDCSVNGVLTYGNLSLGNVNVSFSEDTNITQNQLIVNNNNIVASDIDISNNELKNNIIVPGNITIIDSSANNYGAYTVYTTKDASTHFSVGKSASNVFNIVNQNNAGVYMVSGNNSLTSTSDIRLKKEIEPLEDATERIMKLNPCTYKWKTQTDEKRHVGFIAQEVEEVFPELVRETTYPGGSTYKGVATEDFVGYLIKVMENQENELNLLKEKMK